ncbi:hypothetical protein GCM10009823_10100 [Brevibacterium salitolerans]|uniref:Uncharacterized protein n=1 Tax=Brevibacterium salitolerans TaxID=1403566 RepID=A0ABN2WI04_9MICO
MTNPAPHTATVRIMPKPTLRLRTAPLLLAGLSLAFAQVGAGVQPPQALPTLERTHASEQVVPAAGALPHRPARCSVWKKTNPALYKKYCR